MNIAINGRFLTRRLTGVDRYASELVLALDEIVLPGDFVLVVPGGSELVNELALENIETLRVGKLGGQLWEQTEFASYLRRSGRTAFNPCNTAPLLNPGVVCIHDMTASAHPEFFRGGVNAAWRLVRLAFITRRAKRIVTVSRFSKCEIERFFPRTYGRVDIVPNAWQHLEGVAEDSSVYDAEGLADVPYYFTLCSLAPNKNLRWIANTALANPGSLFVVAGGINEAIFGKADIPVADNVRYVGYVTDGQVKQLMAHCSAFLFPSFYEGFGIPPLEAAACGAKVVVSDIPVMREVFADEAVFVDPNVPLPDIDSVVDGARVPTKALERYSWGSSATALKAVLEALDD